MDPNALWKNYLSLLSDENLGEAADALENLANWIGQGGFEPESLSRLRRDKFDGVGQSLRKQKITIALRNTAEVLRISGNPSECPYCGAVVAADPKAVNGIRPTVPPDGCEFCDPQ